MPLQNRVTPFSTIEVDPARGLFTGNRGILHGEDGELICGTWRHKNWIICELEYNGWKRKVMSGRKWIELFFLDEAVALAAGHRPCAFCRPKAYRAYQSAWQLATGAKPSAKQIDEVLHAERTARIKSLKRFSAPVETLPNGTFFTLNEIQDVPHLIHSNSIFRWTHQGYHIEEKTIKGEVNLITPPCTIQAMLNGYTPVFHNTISELLL